MMTADTPRLRGALHLAALPVAVLAGLALVLAADGALARVAAGVYAVGLAGMLAASAAYHRGPFTDAARRIARRVDHAMIFVLIAATGTPFALLVLEPPLSVALLATSWGGAAAGVGLTVSWPGAPRWVRSVAYLAVGWAGLAAFPALATVGSGSLALLVAGGVLYSAGAVVYAAGRPNPLPCTFGFHEVFHTLVVAAAALHFVAVRAVVA
jgi:hemolysin III